ncbi:hypothetical protein DFH28DRAFT_894635, partial [Melampsora americana]
TITIIIGSFIHSISPDELQLIQNGLIIFNSNGKIIGIETENSSNRKTDLIKRLIKSNHIQPHQSDHLRWIRLRNGEFLIPGFIDTHTHAVQYTNLGVGEGYELLDWLQKFTFPEEIKYSSELYAQKIFEKVVKRSLNLGTTTSTYFLSIHLLASKVLSQVCLQFGQRAFIGKCNMDRNHTFETYKEASVEESIKDTVELIDYIRETCNPEPPHQLCSTSIHPDHSLKSVSDSLEKSCWKKENESSALVQPILTPRFAISCTDELLHQLGRLLSSDPTLRLQTHLSESQSEIDFTQSLFPQIETYTEIYDHFNLLNSRTILAHCVHLSPNEIQLIKKRNSGISHCPTSNFNLRSGICQVKGLMKEGIEKIGLGTDVSGGFGIGILNAIRDGMMASKTLSFHSSSTSTTSKNQTQSDPTSKDSRLSISNLFYLATLGGAKVCNLEDRIGNFQIGKEFDGLIIQTGWVNEVEDEKMKKKEDEEEEIGFGFKDYLDGTNPNFFIDESQDELSLMNLFEKFLFTGDDRNIGCVFVRGRIVGGASECLV